MRRLVHGKEKGHTSNLVFLCVAAFAGVALSPVTYAKPTGGGSAASAQSSTLSDLYRSIDTRTEQVVDAGGGIPATVTLHQASGHSAIPDIAIANVTFAKANVRRAVETLVKGTAIRVTVVGGDDRFGTISAKEVSGKLPVVLENLAETMGFFYTLSNDTLIISAEQTFTLEVDSAYPQERLSEFSDRLQGLGAQFIRKEPHGNALVYRANRRAYLRVTNALQGGQPTDTPITPVAAIVTARPDNAIKSTAQPVLVASLAPVEVVKEQPRKETTLGGEQAAGKASELQTAMRKSITVETHGVPQMAGPSNAASVQTWRSTKSDRTIQSTLERWAKTVGWEVAWEVPRKLPAGFEASFTGSFDVAVEQMMRALRGTDYPIIACLYEANQVLRVVRRGEAKKCDD
jgi:hypothetical protein